MLVTTRELAGMGQLDLGAGFNLNIPAIVGAALGGGSMRAAAARVVQKVEFRSTVLPSFTSRPFADEPGTEGARAEDRTFLAPKYEYKAPALLADDAPIVAPPPAPEQPSFKDEMMRRFLDYSRPSFYVTTPGGVIPIEPYGPPLEDNTGKTVLYGLLLAAGLVGAGALAHKLLAPCPTCA